MSDAVTLFASARVPLKNPRAILDKLCEHFVEHGTVTVSEAGGRIESPLGVALLETDDEALILKAECPDDVALSVVKSALAEHIVMFAKDESPDFVWIGDRAADPRIPYFHEMTVVGARNVTPQMRRVTLAASDVSRLTRGGLHVRILIPPHSRVPVWPTMGHDGRVLWPKGEDALMSRVYTIRRIDEERGQIDVDVVLHGGNHTPGASWATQAIAGDQVGVMGPGGGELPQASRYVLIGDETALPVIARIAESLSLNMQATIILEVANLSEEQPIQSQAAINLRWLHRNGREADTSTALVEAVQNLEWETLQDAFVLVGCEHAAAKAIRSYLRKNRGMPKARHLVAAYWRRGYAETGLDLQD